jgi:hypothetical protein
MFVGRETNWCPACRTYRYVIAQDFLNFIVIYVKITWRLAENIGHVVDLFDSGITNNITIGY